MKLPHADKKHSCEQMIERCTMQEKAAFVMIVWLRFAERLGMEKVSGGWNRGYG